MSTELTGADLELLEKQFYETEKKLQELKEECADLKGKQHFRLNSISENAVFLSTLHILFPTLVASFLFHKIASQAVHNDGLQAETPLRLK